jgi:aspartate racemase
MKTLGIVGGIAPASTIDYYRLLIARYRERKGADEYPSLLINSINLTRLVELVTGNRLTELADWLLVELDRLARGGADIALLASNTPHIVFREIARRSPIPLISIVESAADAARQLGLARLGILGTRYTMEASFYPEALEARGMSVIRPEAGDITMVHSRYMDELILGNFRPAVKDQFIEVIERLKARGAQGILLAGTELPLLLRGADCGIPLLDTAEIHVHQAVEELLV